MAILKVLTGVGTGRELAIGGARTTLGRHPQCEIVLENAAISRQHAQILRVGGDYFVEDLTSRNGTYLNGRPLEGRTSLRGGDELQLSDLRLRFLSSGDSVESVLKPGDESFEVIASGPAASPNGVAPGEKPPTDPELRPPKGSPETGSQWSPAETSAGQPAAGSNVDASQYVLAIPPDPSGDSFGSEEQSFAANLPPGIVKPLSGSEIPLGPGGGITPPAAESGELDASSIVHKFNPQESSSGGRTRTATKLKAVLEIARALTRVLDIDQVLPRTLQTLFRTFPQAEQGYILLQDSRTGRLKVKASQARSVRGNAGPAPDSVAVSMTVVRRAMSTGEAVITSNALDDTRFRASTSVSQLQIRSIMCVPLMVYGSNDEGRAIGVIQLDTRQDGEEFDEEDLELLAAVAAVVSQAVENAEMHEALLAQREMERDLDFATQVQRGFLPNERPFVEGYSFSDYYEAAKSVGGDYYDYITTPDDRIAIVLGDVAGKGVPAALLMARLYSSARYQFLTCADPAEAVTKLNADIIDSGMGARFITFVVMLLDPQQHRLTLANAGHMSPLFRAPDGSVTPISQDISSVPLGILPDQVYRSMTIDFPPGSSILAYTDGVTEAMSAEKAMFGKAKLIESFARIETGIGDAIRGIIEDVNDHSVDTFDRDDTCLVGFAHRG